MHSPQSIIFDNPKIQTHIVSVFLFHTHFLLPLVTSDHKEK